jgi:G3E family GTPase
VSHSKHHHFYHHHHHHHHHHIIIIIGEVFTFGSPHLISKTSSSNWRSITENTSRNKINNLKQKQNTFQFPSFFQISKDKSSYISSLLNVLDLGDSRSSSSRSTGSIGYDESDDLMTIHSMKLSNNIHNVIYNLDPIPRLLGTE